MRIEQNKLLSPDSKVLDLETRKCTSGPDPQISNPSSLETLICHDGNVCQIFILHCVPYINVVSSTLVHSIGISQHFLYACMAL